ncbi:MAG TPA: hypothetical protein VMV12_08270 [Candidatus Micrarchaeaceae archaeon]|nr:hypothetical protein [Candidatus Micrarchaeaceae archaeon]
MGRALRAELLKIRTIRMPFGLLASAALVTLLVVLLEYSRSGAGGRRIVVPPLSGASGQTLIVTSTEFALLLALVMGVTISSGEFRHGTATSTLLAIPDRARVLAAKAIVAAAFGLTFGLLASLVTDGAVLLFLAAKGFTLQLPVATMIQDGAGATLACGLLAAAGAAVGSLIRSQLAAIVGVLLWGLVAEPSLGALFPTGAPYFPYTAARSLTGATAFGHGVASLPFLAAAALVAGVAAGLGLVAWKTTVPRDIA